MSNPAAVARRLRVLVIGGAGQLGTELVLALAAHEVSAPGHAEADVTDPAGLGRAFSAFRPDVVISTAAYHDVDRAELEIDRALAVNAAGAANAARAARDHGARFVWVSTDYVFSGGKGTPYVESDRPQPVNVYGATKLAGEALATAVLPAALIVRTSALYGHSPCRGKGGRNFVDLMLKLGAERGRVRVVDDEATAPTYTPHLASAMVSAIEREATGVLHLTASGHGSWFEFACAIFEESGTKAVVEQAAPGEFPKKAARPALSALQSERGGEFGLQPLPHWRDGLREYLRGRDGAR